jgi:hypothetical protein
MLKKVLIGILAAVMVAALSFGIYNAFASGSLTARAASASDNAGGAMIDPQPIQDGLGTQNGAAAQNRGNGNGNGNRQTNVQGTGTGVPDPQNGFSEWVTYSGTVSAYAAPNFTLLTDDGQSLAVQLGNLNYVSSLGLNLQDGDAVTVTGFVDPDGALAVGQITLAATGETFTLRGEQGRPMWAGGGGNH